MAAGWLGGVGVSTMEPAHLLLAAEVCGGRNPHACHGLGHFSFALSGGLAPALALHHSMAMQLPGVDKSHTTAVSWFAVQLEMVNEKSDRSGCKELPPFISFNFISLFEGVSHRGGPAVLA